MNWEIPVHSQVPAALFTEHGFDLKEQLADVLWLLRLGICQTSSG
jgi:hypothetical protein